MPTLTGLLVTSSEGILTPPNHATATLSLSGWAGKLKIVGGAQGVVAIYTGKMKLWSYGHMGDTANGAVLTLSSAGSLNAFCGGQVIGALSSAGSLNAGGTPESLAEIVVRSPRYSLVSSGTTDANGRAYLTLVGKYPHTILCGATLKKSLPTLKVVSTGTRDALAEVKKTLPKLKITAHGYGDNLAYVVGVLPTLQPASSAVIIAKLPRPGLLIVGTTGALTAYEAYSFTFVEEDRQAMDVAATHYTNYPFDRFVRFNNVYYGVAVDGLYELNGNDFNGTPIISTVETANTDFGAREMKRPISLYIAGEVGADFRVSVNSAEVRDDAYSLRTVDKTGARNYRVLFGKGIRARYLSYKFTNTNGGDFVLDDLTPEFVVTRRTA